MYLKTHQNLKPLYFYMSEGEFKSQLEILTSTTINDFDETDDKYENQLKSIISQLQESAEIMKSKMC